MRFRCVWACSARPGAAGPVGQPKLLLSPAGWAPLPPPPPSQGPLLGAGVDEGISLISKITASYAEQEEAVKTKGS